MILLSIPYENICSMCLKKTHRDVSFKHSKPVFIEITKKKFAFPARQGIDPHVYI